MSEDSFHSGFNEDFHGDFHGAKIAIISRGAVLSLLRDDDQTIAYPNMWDLPGGGREGGECPERTALRELDEELGLRLDPARIRHRTRYGGARGNVWFFGAIWQELDPARIRLGGEGQRWELMPVARFLTCADAIPHLQLRLDTFLREIGDSV